MLKFTISGTNRSDIQDLYQSDNEEERREKFANERQGLSKGSTKIPENLGMFKARFKY